MRDPPIPGVSLTVLEGVCDTAVGRKSHIRIDLFLAGDFSGFTSLLSEPNATYFHIAVCQSGIAYSVDPAFKARLSFHVAQTFEELSRRHFKIRLAGSALMDSQ